MSELTLEKQLHILSRAWGRNQEGYCFFPWVSGDATEKSERVQSWHDPYFFWPRDKHKILEHMAEHIDDDLYWCPSLFELPKRQTEHAMDEHALWADLDNVDPNTLRDTQYDPTIAWETSPGRFQALWVLSAGDVQGASWPGQINQCLTYYLHADHSGWDTTQLLRIPGWRNHKIEYKEEYGRKGAPGKLLWSNGRTYLPDDFEDLPEVPSVVTEHLTDVIEAEIDAVDRFEVWARIRLKINRQVREYLALKEPAPGDRSSILWQIERELADAGCSVPEIVAIARASVWNKYVGRADELKRLITEASKAYNERSGTAIEAIESIEDDEDKPEITNLLDQLANITPPRWLVKDLFAEGCCGFIAGQPKFHKSWIALDLAFSIATGARFLDYFAILNPGPVLYIQSEDAPPTVKQRVDKILPSKQQIEISRDMDGEICMGPPPHIQGKVDIDGCISSGFTISNDGWQLWLDEALAERPYRMVIMDPFMMMAGDVNENLSQEMTAKVFRPLKQLARKYNTAMILVHHMKKSEASNASRGGLRLLGSVAGHAWAEDSLYVNSKAQGKLNIEHETKHGVAQSFKLSGVLRSTVWQPCVTKATDSHDEAVNNRIIEGAPKEIKRNGYARRSGTSGNSSGRISGANALHAIRELGGVQTVSAIADYLTISPQGARSQLKRLQSQNLAKQVSGGWTCA